MILTYTPEIRAKLDDFDKLAPPPRQTLTIEEVAKIFDMAKGSLSNMKSQSRLPFQVLKVGGSVHVDKMTLAKYMLGIKDDNFQPVGATTAKPKNKGGRPKNSSYGFYANSDGLQRYATQLFLTAYYKIVEENNRTVSSPMDGKTYPLSDKKRFGR